VARAVKNFITKAEREADEARRLARKESRARRRHEKRTLAMASQAAEGTTDFEKLVEVEKERLGIEESKKAAGGRASPRVTVTARDNLAKAFDLMGGVPALVVWGRANPTEFYRLWARLVPKESVEASVSLPLETLLQKLSEEGSAGHSVMDAAAQVGHDLLEYGRHEAMLIDLDARVVTDEGDE